MTADPTRRLVLAAASSGLLLLAGCRGVEALGRPPGPGPGVAQLRRAITAEEAMVRTYQAALAALGGHARAAALAGELLAQHQEHLVALRSRLVLPGGSRLARPPAPSAPLPLGSGRRAVISALATAERDAAARLLGLLPAAPPELAQLMASIGASEAGHAAVLDPAALA